MESSTSLLGTFIQAIENIKYKINGEDGRLNKEATKMCKRSQNLK